ncbi:MAG: T9SS type A sorting domain-containing protein [Bacteroidota bacterium]|nr:T9SS type A sorting domain-containing protein [Bacteroidota bacterium]
MYCLKISAQPPARFYTTFGGNGIDVGYSAKQTLDRHYIVAGSTSSYGAGNSDVYLVKLDSMGQILWSKTFGGFLNDVGKSVIQLADSGYVVAGFTSSYGAGGYDAYIIRTDKLGTLIWQRTFGGTDWDFANDLVYSPDGDIMVVGNTSSFGSGKKDGFVLKYDFLGNIVFQKYYGGAEDDELKSIIRTNDNFIATVGYTKSKGEINGDCYFLKLDLNGDTLFTKTFGGAFKDYANDLVQKANDDYVICGAKTFSLNAKTSSVMYSLGQNGSFLWENNYQYDSNNDEEYSSVCNVNFQTSFNAYIRNIIISGLKSQALMSVNINSGWPYKANDSGGGDDDFTYSLEKTYDGGYIEVGTTNSFGALNGDIYFLRRDTSLINYTSIVGIKNNEQNQDNFIISYLQNNFILIKNFNQSESISEIKIYTIEGKEVKSIKFINEPEYTLDLNNLPESFFLLEITTKNKLYHFKILKK